MSIQRVLGCFFIFTLVSCTSKKELPTVANVDIDKYLGKWYEIARKPAYFEKDLDCVTTNYSLKKNGEIEVFNRGVKIKSDEKVKTAKGTAWVPNKLKTGELKVSFFWPFTGDYFIVALDKTYQYSLVGDQSRKYLWILSRTKTLEETIYSSLLQIAKNNGFNIDDLIKTKQTCNN